MRPHIDVLHVVAREEPSYGSAPSRRIERGVRSEPCSQHQWQNNPDDDEARKSVRDEPYPGALIPLRGKGLSQHPVENAGGHTPRLVHVVEAKDGPVDDPVDPSEHLAHSRQQEAAEEDPRAACSPTRLSTASSTPPAFDTWSAPVQPGSASRHVSRSKGVSASPSP